MLIVVADGYNGHKVALDTEKVKARGQRSTCLMVADSEYLFEWVRNEDIEHLTLAQSCCGQHNRHYGELWQCANCKRSFCFAEGTDDHPELCDACWCAQPDGSFRPLSKFFAVNEHGVF